MMKRLSTEILGFVFTAVLLTMGLRWMSNQFAPVYSLEKYRVKQLLARANEIEAISLGHSLNRALDFKELQLKGYHLWDPGSDYFEVDYQLRALAPRLPNLKVVFIPLGSSCFFVDNGLIRHKHERRRRCYAVTPLLVPRPIHGDRKNLVAGMLSDIVRPDHWKGVFETMAFATVEPESRNASKVDEYGTVLRERIYKEANQKSLQKAIRYLQKAFENEEEKVYRENPKIPEKIYQTLASLVKYLRERKVRVIFYLPPFTDIFNEKVRQDQNVIAYERTAESYIQRLVENFGVEYYDFSHDSSFVHNYSYFIDPHHLNVKGAEIFSRKLWSTCGLPVVPAGQSAGR